MLDELLFVVGGGSDLPADGQAALHFHGGLGVVALLENSTGFHDPAFGIGEIVLFFRARFLLGCREGLASRLVAGLALEGAFHEFLVLAAEGADGVVVRVGVAGEGAHGKPGIPILLSVYI